MAFVRRRPRAAAVGAIALAATLTQITVVMPVAMMANSLPSPWSSMDIGAVGIVGSASVVDGVFTVQGAGADIWGSADGFHFASQPLSGNGEIVARVTTVQKTHTYAKAGVMLRGALTAGSAHVILDVKPGGGVEFMKRASNGGTTSFVAGANVSAPVWLRLARNETTVVASWSSDGAAWFEVGRTTITLPASAFAGLAVTSHITSALNTSTFDNVRVAPDVPNQPPTVAVTTPVNGAAFTAPASIAIAATAADVDGGIASVQFLAGSVALGTDATSPYEWVWTQLPAGTYAISAIATDSSGAKTQSAPVSVTVNPDLSAPPPAAPSTGWPADASTTVDVSTALNWVASQDATSYDVTFGTTSSPAIVAMNQTTTSFQPTSLAYNTTYYWQVIAKNAAGSAPSAVWSFTTRSGASTSPQPSTSLRRLRVMTWHVNAGRNAAGAVALDAQVSLIARSGAHVVMLQGVTAESTVDSASYLEKLQSITGRTWTPLWAEDAAVSGTTPRGNLVLSALPVISAEVVALNGAPFEPSNIDAQRSAARVAVLVNNVAVTLVTTTLAVDGQSRQSQIRQLRSWLSALPAPRLIGGSWNMQPGDAGYADLAADFADVWPVLVTTPDRGITTEALAPAGLPGRIDAWWQDLNGTRAKATEVWIVKTRHSTHHAVIAEVNVQ